MARRKHIDMDTKVAKFFVATRLKGKKKTPVAKELGMSPTNIFNYEQTPLYKALEEKYKDKLLKHLKMDDAAIEHVKIIKQDRDLGAKLNAIKFFAERVEPEVKEDKDDDRMVVVLRA